MNQTISGLPVDDPDLIGVSSWWIFQYLQAHYQILCLHQRLIEQIPAQNARRLSLHDYPDKTSAGDALSWAHAARMFQLKWFKSWIVYPNATSSGYLHVASKQEWLAALWLSWNTSCPLVSWFQPPRWIFWLLHAGKSWLAIDIWDWHTWNLSSSWVAQNRQGNWRGNHWQKMQTLVKHPFPVVNSSALLCFSASFFWVGYKKGHTPWFSDDWIIEKKRGRLVPAHFFLVVYMKKIFHKDSHNYAGMTASYLNPQVSTPTIISPQWLVIKPNFAG